MTQDEIIEMAKQANAGMLHGGGYSLFGTDAIERFAKLVAQHERNDTLEEVASKFERMPFGDTAASFAVFVRNMKT